MRISNITNYLGGADNVIVREITEGNQILLNINTDDTSIDFSDANTVFDIKAECFDATVESTRGSLSLTNLQLNPNATKKTYTKTELIHNTGTAGQFDLLVPSTLLSDQNPTFTSTADTTNPFVVVMKVQWSNGTPVVKNSIRFVFIIRYQPQ